MTNTPDTNNHGEQQPLAVWACAQQRSRSSQRLRAEIARRAISLYSDPGDLVLDPCCDDPDATTLVEAIHLGRNALGVTGLDPERTADTVLALQEAKRAGAGGEARLLVGLCEASQLPRLLAHQARDLLQRCGSDTEPPDVARHPCGAAALVLLLNPIAEGAAHRRLGRRGDPGEELIAACAALLRPGGFLVATPQHDGVTGDPTACLVELALAHGLRYWQHVIALAVPIRDGGLDAAGSEEPRCHRDLVVLRKPTAAKAADAKAPRRSP